MDKIQTKRASLRMSSTRYDNKYPDQFIQTRKKIIITLHLSGHSMHKLSKAFKMSSRTIWSYINKCKTIGRFWKHGFKPIHINSLGSVRHNLNHWLTAWTRGIIDYFEFSKIVSLIPP